jgi:hypothetical protein
MKPVDDKKLPMLRVDIAVWTTTSSFTLVCNFILQPGYKKKLAGELFFQQWPDKNNSLLYKSLGTPGHQIGQFPANHANLASDTLWLYEACQALHDIFTSQ